MIDCLVRTIRDFFGLKNVVARCGWADDDDLSVGFGKEMSGHGIAVSMKWRFCPFLLPGSNPILLAADD